MTAPETRLMLADRIEELRSLAAENWRVEKEPHPYNDGTDHFNHVRYTAKDFGTVEVASYVSSNLGELLCLLNNNIDTIVAALRTTEPAGAGLEPCTQAELDAWETEKDTKTGRLLQAWMDRALKAEEALALPSSPMGLNQGTTSVSSIGSPESEIASSPEDINLAREWMATVQPVNGQALPAEMQGIIDTIERALELAMEDILVRRKPVPNNLTGASSNDAGTWFYRQIESSAFELWQQNEDGQSCAGLLNNRISAEFICEKLNEPLPNNLTWASSIEGRREEIARIVDPDAFEGWQSLFDSCLKDGMSAETAARCADKFYRTSREEAIEAADAILALLAHQRPERPVSETIEEGQ
jgi:hypothetical protein